MIKINKNINDIPGSLIPAFEDLFPERIGTTLTPVPQISRTTHSRRLEIIEANSYIELQKFNNRYKQEDVKFALTNIYKGKCAFCEQRQEITHVEHYRPKSRYYWLAYSWDNLLMSCPSCNGFKDVHFDIDGVNVVFENNEVNIRNINSSGSEYDVIEVPLMVNPEVTDPFGLIEFERSGVVKSDDRRFGYTISKCKIDRKPLNDSRRSILDRFQEHIRDALLANATVEHQIVAITANIRNFINDAQNAEEDFLAFRNYAIANNWLNEIVKENTN